MKYWTMIAALCFPLAACGGETSAEEVEETVAATLPLPEAERTGQTAAEREANNDEENEESASAAELPVEDFEEEGDISDENYEAILAELEGEFPQE